ncbi:MAG TPA: hypothetical protein VGF75_06475 [Candidatus Saccharimonadales bacterium]
MKSQFILSLSLILATTALAQAKPDVKPAARVEGKKAVVDEHKGEKTIPTDMIAKFFKAQSHALQAQQAADATPQAIQAKNESVKFQVIIQEMQSYCGKGFNLMIDNKSEDPACAPIPETKKTPTATPAGPQNK